LDLYDFPLINQLHSTLFKLFDKYARKKYRCFVSELFENKEAAALVICFRPEGSDRGSPLQYACQYVRIGRDGVQQAILEHKLTESSIRGRLDLELAQFDLNRKNATHSTDQ
jgi:hypothetical protein